MKGKKGFQKGHKRFANNSATLGKRWRLRNSRPQISKRTKEKMSKAHKGENNGNWKNGKSFEPYPMDWTITLRRAIRERDHYVCRLCGKPQGDIAHDVHHINYNKTDCSPENLITLCRSCHTKTNHNRKKWEIYFKKLCKNKI